MTTRYSSSAALMEMAVFMKRHRLKALVEWTPREANREADELANGVVHRFAPSLEVKIQPEQLSRYVLPEMLDVGAKVEEAHRRAVERARFRTGLKGRRRGSQKRGCGFEIRGEGGSAAWMRKNPSVIAWRSY